MTKIISIANHKGGVGKTTTVASVGSRLASKGFKVLAVDLDAQANLTTSLLGDETDRSIYEALREESGLPKFQISENFWLTPSSLDLAGVELDLASAMRREYILQDLLNEEAKEFDYILIDCPPALGLVTINALVASSDVIIPLTAEALPFKGLRMITTIIERVQKKLNKSLRLSGIVINRWNSRKLNRAVEEALRERFGQLMFDTKIRENITVAEAPLANADIFSYDPGCNGAKDYADLTEEILAKIPAE